MLHNAESEGVNVQVRLEHVEKTLRDRRRFHALALLCSNSGASAEALTLWQVRLPMTSSFHSHVKGDWPLS